MRISWRMIAFFVVVVLAATSLLISKLIRDRSIELKELPAPLLKPVTLGISAELGWQNTGTCWNPARHSRFSLCLVRFVIVTLLSGGLRVWDTFVEIVAVVNPCRRFNAAPSLAGLAMIFF
jgi:hypothetical protein